MRIGLLVCVSLMVVLSNDVETKIGPGPGRSTRQSTLDTAGDRSARDVLTHIQAMRKHMMNSFESFYKCVGEVR